MKILKLENVLKATRGHLLSETAKQFKGIGTDTRLDLSDRLFIALKGDSFDAHQFLMKVIESKAAGALIHHNLEDIGNLDSAKIQELKSKLTIIKVDDTLQALQDLGHFERRQSSAIVVGITGSNGKTTSKEFSGAVIGSVKKVHQPKGSFNNHWGVPMTLLAEMPGTEVSLIEMGMNHAGEIKRLCEIAEPDVAVVSMVGRAHIEHFGTIEKIAEAKEEIYKFAKPNAMRIYNLDNELCLKMYQKSAQQFPHAKRIMTFSESNSAADIYLQISELSMSSLKIQGRILDKASQAEVPVFGRQNLTNIMVAASVAIAVGLSPEQVWKALPLCRTSWGRNQLVKLKSGAELLFDAYNANPDSMKALLENIKLISTSGKKIGVFAQMKELGAHSANLHTDLGQLVAQSGFDLVWFYGDDSSSFEAGMKKENFNKTLYISNSYEESLASKVASVLNPSDRLIVKGSRGMKMERFVLACHPENFSLKKED